MIKNVAIFRFNMKIFFDENQWYGVSGNINAPVLLEILARYNPHINFYIISTNDLDNFSAREKIKKYKNIINIYDYIKISKRSKEKLTEDDEYKIIYNFFKERNIKIDFGLAITGVFYSYFSFARKIYKDKEKKILNDFPKSNLTSFSNVMYFLNESKIPWFFIISDIKSLESFKNVLDIFNLPRKILIQGEGGIFKKKHLTDFYLSKYDTVKTNIEMINYPLDLLYFYKKEKFKPVFKKDYSFVIMSNYAGKKVRLKVMKKFAEEFNLNFKIFGNWDKVLDQLDDKIKNNLYPGIKHKEINNFFKDVKYTFIDNSNKLTFSTLKLWEMLYSNVVVFIYNGFYKYKTPDNYPNFLIVNNFKEMEERIKFLEENYDEYVKIKEQLNKLLLNNNLYNGKYLNDLLIKEMLNNI